MTQLKDKTTQVLKVANRKVTKGEIHTALEQGITFVTMTNKSVQKRLMKEQAKKKRAQELRDNKIRMLNKAHEEAKRRLKPANGQYAKGAKGKAEKAADDTIQKGAEALRDLLTVTEGETPQQAAARVMEVINDTKSFIHPGQQEQMDLRGHAPDIDVPAPKGYYEGCTSLDTDVDMVFHIGGEPTGIDPTLPFDDSTVDTNDDSKNFGVQPVNNDAEEKSYPGMVGNNDLSFQYLNGSIPSGRTVMFGNPKSGYQETAADLTPEVIQERENALRELDQEAVQSSLPPGMKLTDEWGGNGVIVKILPDDVPVEISELRKEMILNPEPNILFDQGLRLNPFAGFVDHPRKQMYGNNQGQTTPVPTMVVLKAIPELKENQVALNIYGNESKYQPYPILGERVRPDGIIAAIRTFEGKPVLSHDDLVKLKAIDHLQDEVLYDVPGAFIVDEAAYKASLNPEIGDTEALQMYGMAGEDFRGDALSGMVNLVDLPTVDSIIKDRFGENVNIDEIIKDIGNTDVNHSYPEVIPDFSASFEKGMREGDPMVPPVKLQNSGISGCIPSISSQNANGKEDISQLIPQNLCPGVQEPVAGTGEVVPFFQVSEDDPQYMEKRRQFIEQSAVNRVAYGNTEGIYIKPEHQKRPDHEFDPLLKNSVDPVEHLIDMANKDEGNKDD